MYQFNLDSVMIMLMVTILNGYGKYPIRPIKLIKVKTVSQMF